MLFRFIFIYLFANSLLAQGDTIDSTNVILRQINMSNVMHYSGYYKGLRSNGHIVSDTSGNIISESMYCASFEDTTIFYYRLTKYFPNQKIEYDSILDFTKKRTARSNVIAKDSLGKLEYSLKLKSKLNPKRDDIPLRSETLWYGREVYFNARGKKTIRKIHGETR